MRTSNISYLRNHLSDVLAYVREGETVIVLDRNKPIARLAPYCTGEAAMTERMKELQQLGLLAHGPSREAEPLPPPIRIAEPIDLTCIIREDRERP